MIDAALTADDGALLVALARAAIEHRLFGGERPADLHAAASARPALGEARGCFVTLRALSRAGLLELRGCIGCLEAALPAHEAVAGAALDAAFADPRFAPLTRDEYPSVRVTVSVLTSPAPIADPGHIEVGVDGVVLECDGRRSIFLPEVAVEHGWGRERLLEELTRKAGLPPASWRRGHLSVFRSLTFTDGASEAARIRPS
jgi:AmmeMemoRadiSam system protein A